MLGARIIEKHFTLNRAMKGTDHRFSLEPVGMKKMIRDLRRVRMALGDGRKKVYASEASPVLKMGKKLVAARDLPAGHVLTIADVAIKSPGDGLPPYCLDQIVGQALSRGVRANRVADARARRTAGRGDRRRLGDDTPRHPPSPPLRPSRWGLSGVADASVPRCDSYKP